MRAQGISIVTVAELMERDPELWPKLYELDGQTIPVKTKGRGGEKNEGRVVGPKWEFKRYGKCGKNNKELPGTMLQDGLEQMAKYKL